MAEAAVIEIDGSREVGILQGAVEPGNIGLQEKLARRRGRFLRKLIHELGYRLSSNPDRPMKCFCKEA